MITVNEANFNEEVINSNLPVVLDFWATWCPPCKAMLPILQKLSEELEGKVKFCKVNFEENTNLADMHNLMAVPTLVFYREGKLLEQKIIGMATAENIKE